MDSASLGWVDGALRLGIGAVMVWVAKTTQELAIEVRGMRAHLFGENGENGLNGTVRELKRQIEASGIDRVDLHSRVAVIRTEIEHLKEDRD